MGESIRYVDLNRREKLEHLWYYYKYHLVGGALIALFVIHIISGIIGGKSVKLHVLIVGPYISSRVASTFSQETTQALYPDSGRNVVKITVMPIIGKLTSPQNHDMQAKLATLIATHDVGVIIMPKEDFLTYAGLGSWKELNSRLYMTPRHLNQPWAIWKSQKNGHSKAVGINLYYSSILRHFISPTKNGEIAGVVKGTNELPQSQQFLQWMLKN